MQNRHPSSDKIVLTVRQLPGTLAASIPPRFEAAKGFVASSRIHGDQPGGQFFSVGRSVGDRLALQRRRSAVGSSGRLALATKKASPVARCETVRCYVIGRQDVLRPAVQWLFARSILCVLGPADFTTPGVSGQLTARPGCSGWREIFSLSRPFGRLFHPPPHRRWRQSAWTSVLPRVRAAKRPGADDFLRGSLSRRQVDRFYHRDRR